MKVLIVDDEPDIREIIEIIFCLRWPDSQVVTASTGREGLQLASAEAPDLVLMDLRLPDVDGFDLIAPLRRAAGAPIIILTARSSQADKVLGLDRCADDYITKPFSHLELMARVRAVLRRHHAPVVGSGPPYRKGDLCIDFGSHDVTVGSKRVQLEPVEHTLLYHLVKNPGRPMSSKTLLAKVWGREYTGETDLLRLHIQRLRKKVERDPDQPHLIKTEAGVGYRFVEPD